MTSTRWWAPTDARIGPDEIDLAMLDVSGDDARLDLGGALLAAHRVGDAACQAAAATPLCDEGTLVTALASARAQLGEPMVDAVSKCVEGGSYGGLLVRDVLDDADSAAIELYRAAVARGVAPSVAASRVGAVYGVPSSALGAYRPVAIDPKAQFPALIDKADRALFTYVEKLCTEEADTRVTVSKAPAAVMERPQTAVVTPDDPATPYYDARGEGGRFVAQAGLAAPGLLGRLRTRYGIGGQAAPDVATGRPSETAAEREPSAKIVSVQELRQKREKARNLAGPRRKPKTKPAEETERASQTRTKQQRARQNRVRQKMAKQTRLSPMLARELTPLADPQPFLQPNHPLLERQGSPPVNYQNFDHEVGFVLDEADAFHLTRLIASSPGSITRIGHVTDMHGGNPEELGTPAYDDLVENVAVDASGGEPEYKPIPLNDLPDDPDEQERVLAYEAQKWASAHADPNMERTSWMPNARSEGFVIFTQDPHEPLPKVFEFVVHNARGRIEGTHRHMDHVLDPDQAYVVNDPTAWKRDSEFDPVHGVVRSRVTLTPVDEATVDQYRRGIHPGQARRRVQKAETAVLERPAPVLVRPDDPETPYFDARASNGRFAAAAPVRPGLLSMHTRSPAPEEVATTTPARPVSVSDLRNRQNKVKSLTGPKRKTRRSQTQNAADAPESRAAQRRAGQQRRSQQKLSPLGRARQQLQSAASDRFDRESPVPQSNLILDGSHAYRVLDNDDFQDLQHRVGDLNTVSTGVLHIRAQDDLAELDSQNHMGHDVLPAIRQAHFDLVQATSVPRRVGQFDTSTLQGQVQFARTAHDYAHKRDTAMVIETPTDENGEMSELRVHSGPEPMVLVEFDESADPNGPYDLIPMGEVTHRDRSRSEDDRWTGGLNHHFQIPVKRYLAVDPSRTDDVLRHTGSRSNRRSGS